MKVNTDTTKQSWSSIPKDAAKTYLHYYPKTTIEEISTFIKKVYLEDQCNIIDVCCGNSQIYSYLKERNIDFSYTGIDFSKPLILEAMEVTENDPNARIVESDCYSFLEKDNQRYNVAICSHILELVESPDLLLHYLSNKCDFIAIRWYEPPIHDFHVDEVKRSAHSEHAENAPYIRRKMSVDYYTNLLNKHNLELVNLEGSGKDILHILKNKMTLEEKERKKYNFVHEWASKNDPPESIGRQLRFLLDGGNSFTSFWKKLSKNKELKFLEIGLGAYEILQWLDKEGFIYGGVDISNYIVDSAKKELVNSDLVKCANANHLPFDSNYFDVVQHLDGMEHIPVEWELDCLKEAVRVSKKYVLYANAGADAYLDKISEDAGMTKVHINIKNPDEWKEFYSKNADDVGYNILLDYTKDDTYYTVLEVL